MKHIRINDLARELGVKSRHILRILPDCGVMSQKSHASSLEENEAANVRTHFKSASDTDSHSKAISGGFHGTVLHTSNKPNLRQRYIQAGLISSRPRASRKRKDTTPPRPRIKVGRRRSTGKDSKKGQKNIRSIVNRRLDPKKMARYSTQILPTGSSTYAAASSAIDAMKQKNISHHIESYNPVIKVPSQTGGLTTTAGGLPVRIIPVQEPSFESHRETVACGVSGCNDKVFPEYMERHIENRHSKKQELHLQSLSSSRLPFVLLPPGNWGFRQMFEHHNKRSRAARFFEQIFDIKRINQIRYLKGELRYLGLKSWSGYGVYEFPYSDRVALECPIKGNATYILSGDWKEMIRLSKAVLRQEYKSRCTKVVHSSNWRDQVRRALQSGHAHIE